MCSVISTGPKAGAGDGPVSRLSKKTGAAHLSPKKKIGLAAVLAFACQAVWPFTIESPQPGERVMPGQTVWLIVQPSSPTESDIQAVQVLVAGANGCEDVQPTTPIQCALTVPDGSDGTPIPTAIDIRIHLTFGNGTEQQASTSMKVVELPPALIALEGDPRDQPLTFEAAGQERNLTVIGRSVDGATHDLRGRSRGTTYEINNPAIIAVRDDGRVVAKGIGTATITVRNGPLSFQVPVIVGRSNANGKS